MTVTCTKNHTFGKIQDGRLEFGFWTVSVASGGTFVKFGADTDIDI